MAYTIADHWDTERIIDGDSDPVVEFVVWNEYAQLSDDWTGDEFTIEDFSRYIESL